MWKRLQTKRHPQIGNPTLLETTLDERAYPDLQDGGTPGKAPSQHNGQPRILPKGLPSLPLAPPQSLEVQDTTGRPASSVYSQPSPNPQVAHFPRDLDVASLATPTTTYTGDLSAPSSPKIEPTQPPSLSNRKDTILPIQEDTESAYSHTAPLDKAPTSSIPVLRREKQRNQSRNAAPNNMARFHQEQEEARRNKSAAPKYDPYTGEPTTSERGKPQRVKPSAFNPGDAPVLGLGQHGMGTTTHITSASPKPQTSFSERMRRLKENNVMTANRPEWKGASGRQAVVKPIADDPDPAPIVPVRSPSRDGPSHANGIPGQNTPVSIIGNDPSGTPYVSPTMKGPIPTASPPIPQRDSRRSPSPQVSSNDLRSTALPLRSNPDHAYPSPANSDPRSPDIYNIPTNGSVSKNALPSLIEERPLSSGGPRRVESIESDFRQALKDLNTSDQPASRFSITTYATSAASGTPRQSTDVPPSPTSPISPTQKTPIVNRKRPQIGPIENTKVVARKAIPSSRTASMSTQSDHTSKTLPKTPGEAKSIDLIGSLQAQLDNLGQRRQNIQKSIHQMTALMPADVGIRNSVVVRRRDDEKKKVEALKENLADVQAQEHTLGLKLHRALKRRDQSAVYEPTGLWVRRVTG